MAKQNRPDNQNDPQRSPDQGQLPQRNRQGVTESPDKASRRTPSGVAPEGATEDKIGNRTGPGVGYDQEPRREEDEGGVS
jgi:hypothetical protein